MNQSALLESILSDAEKAVVKNIVDNPISVAALKKVLLASIYFNGTLQKGKDPNPTLNAALSLAFSNEKKTDAELGADLRGLAEGVRLLEMGFKQLENYKSKPAPAGATPNGAR